MTPNYYTDEKVRPSKYAIIRWFRFDQFVPERAVTSYWVSSKIFFVIRFILALYSTVVFWFYLIALAIYADFSSFFAQFTTLTFIGLHAYLVVNIHSTWKTKKRKKWKTHFFVFLDILCLSFSLFTIKKCQLPFKSTFNIKLFICLPV